MFRQPGGCRFCMFYICLMALLNVSAVEKKEENDFLLKNISFEQQPLQNVAIAGATGSGKTTLLKIIAGLIQPTAGEVLFEGQRVKGPEEKLLPGHPGIGYLSQHFELRNHYRVKEILEMSNQFSDQDAELIYQVCRIDHLLTRWTHQLSGGEKQRIALAKTLVSSPKLLLLDEPFSNLDAIHKGILKSVINDIDEQLKITAILVSHDPPDLLSWADEIIILKDGAIVQKGKPQEVYHSPVDDYTAALFGKYNLLTKELARLFGLVSTENSFIFARPEDFQITHENPNAAEALINKVIFMGSIYQLEVEVRGNSITLNANKKYKKGDKIFVAYSPVSYI